MYPTKLKSSIKNFQEYPFQIVHRIEAWDKISLVDVESGKSIPNHEGVVFDCVSFDYTLPIMGDECLGLFQIFNEIFDNYSYNDNEDCAINAWANYNFITKTFILTSVTENEFYNYKELGFKVLSIDDLLLEAVLGTDSN